MVPSRPTRHPGGRGAHGRIFSNSGRALQGRLPDPADKACSAERDGRSVCLGPASGSAWGPRSRFRSRVQRIGLKAAPRRRPPAFDLYDQSTAPNFSLRLHSTLRSRRTFLRCSLPCCFWSVVFWSFGDEEARSAGGAYQKGRLSDSLLQDDSLRGT